MTIIKQIMPDYYSPMLPEGDGSFVDAAAVVYALMDDGRVAFYIMDQTGCGEVDDIAVRLAPARYCPGCGTRMLVSMKNNHLEYRCLCGKEM